MSKHLFSTQYRCRSADQSAKDREMPDQFLSLSIVYEDEHLIKLEVRAAYAGWAACARAYTTISDLRESIERLAQFGTDLSGNAVMEAGQEDLGLFSFRMCTYGGARHLACHVRIITQTAMLNLPYEGAFPKERWQFSVTLKTEAALYDKFIDDLRLVADHKSERAVLVAVRTGPDESAYRDTQDGNDSRGAK